MMLNLQGHTRLSAFCAHLFAGAMALCFAWYVFRSGHMTSGFQFVGPLLTILICHLIWILIEQGLGSGFSKKVLVRLVKTAFLLLGFVLALFLFLPTSAQSEGVLATIGGIFGAVLICLLIIAYFIVVYGVPILLLYLLCRYIYGKLSPSPKNYGGDMRLFDFGSIAVASGMLLIAGLEGMPRGYSFDAANQSSTRVLIDAPVDDVWQVMDNATAPSFPLPQVLRALPRPTKVMVDEGVELGSRRIVQFEGREGKGKLSMVVIERTDTKAVFKVLSDTSPIGNWIGHKYLTYEVYPVGRQSELRVSLDFERKLAPFWFFTPVMKTGTYLAMSVLARDTKHRAEAFKHSVTLR